ncbi:putative efflux pump antibiotic resistance [Rosellinia necatrix]|uniref:Putative efflux pump antibiotic resistance n=1 Tax=Rosellinia necatrix TaxID=77044 RepID=A0A1W2TSJ7_ROSNE|nr:putative efflux pump antibiotic resistance [Rosellinia necatrix]
MSSQQTATESLNQPGARRLSLIMIGLCLAVFLTGMDQTILATATPVISDEFGALADISWWSNAYLLTLSSLQLFYGKLYSLFSIKLVYLSAIGLFEIGSLVCTVAPNSIALIVGRAIAGLGAAGIFSGGVLITTKLIPLSQRASYLGIMSGVFGLAAIIGPFLGGALTDRATWRWCFGINLPLGAVTIVVCAFLVKLPPRDLTNQSTTALGKLSELDVPGTVSLVASLISLLIALQWGGSTYPWNDGRIIALLVVFGVLAIVFFITQTTSFLGKANTIPPAVAKNRDIWFAASYAVGITGGVYVAVLYLPVWFQALRGYSALSSGILLIPLIAGYVVGSVIAGGLTSAIGYYNPGMIIGSVLAIAGSALLTTLDLSSNTAHIIGYQLLYGFGVGFGFGQPSYVVQTVLDTIDVPIGVTLITLLQNLSASIFVAVAQSIFQGELRRRISLASPDTDLSDIAGSGAGNFLSAFPPGEQAAARQGYSKSLLLTLYVSLALSASSSVGAICTRWGSMKGDIKNEATVTEKEQAESDDVALRAQSGSEDMKSEDATAVLPTKEPITRSS